MVSRATKILAALLLVLGAAVVAQEAELRLPANNQGYQPEQPIAYSHALHAGELGIDCRYCHFGSERSRHAGIPPASVCMNCHAQLPSNTADRLAEENAAANAGRDPVRVFSPEIQKIYDALALDIDLEPIPGQEPVPIEWVRVHNLPDFVYFDHRPHVWRGDVECQDCHGPIETMERVYQFSDLRMGWCVNCHRDNPRVEGGNPLDDHVTTNCSACHY